MMKGLFQGKISLRERLGALFAPTRHQSREELLEELEETLVLADLALPLVERVLKAVRQKGAWSRDEVLAILEAQLLEICRHSGEGEIVWSPGPQVLLMVGINGSGKTTSTAKLARRFVRQGRRVLLGATDTFRAAGSTQLGLWGERLGIPVVTGEQGADPGSVLHNSLSVLAADKADLLLVDTAGRVQTRENLMKELEKMTRIVQKFFPQQPAHVLLVVDANQGQNTLEQARRFRSFSGVTGLVLSKADGTARGGTLLGILDELQVPVHYLGTGETADDLEPFSSERFVRHLLAGE